MRRKRSASIHMIIKHYKRGTLPYECTYLLRLLCHQQNQVKVVGPQSCIVEVVHICQVEDVTKGFVSSDSWGRASGRRVI